MSSSNKNIKKNLASKASHKGSAESKGIKSTSNWIKEIKKEIRYKNERITSTIPLNVVDKNWRCLDCNKYYKATCANDITKHIQKSVLHQKSKARRKAEGKSQTNLLSVNDKITKTKYNYFHTMFIANVSGNAAITISNRCLRKLRIPFSQQLPSSASEFTQGNQFMLQQYEHRMDNHVKEQKLLDNQRYYHWSFLIDEGEANRKGIMVSLTAFDGTTKQIMTHGM